MDKFVLIVGIVGLVLLCISFIVIISAIVMIVKKRTSFRKIITSLLIFLISFGFALAFIYMALFMQTFSRYVNEERVGWLYAYRDEDHIKMTFYNQQTNRLYWCTLAGDQWMIEGYMLRWSTFLRWLGAGSYYRVTRFSGRWVVRTDAPQELYQLYPEEPIWKFLLTHGQKIPLIDAVYGIGAFQYPLADTVYIHVNDTGFILRTD